MIKSKKISGPLTDDVKLGKKEIAKSSPKKGGTKNPKPYPIPEEDNFATPDDDSAEVKYNIKKKS